MDAAVMTTSAAAHGAVAKDAPSFPKKVEAKARPHVDLPKIRAELEKIDRADPATAPAYDEEGEPLWEPVVAMDSISRADFRDWLAEHDGYLRHWCYEPIDEETGRVVVYHLPSQVHEASAGAIVSSITAQVDFIGKDYKLASKTLSMMASPTCHLEDRDQEPDASLKPKECLRAKYPNLVVEIEYKNQSLRKLNETLLRWMDPKTTVQVAIGIKIYKASKKHVAILHVRGKEPTVVNFGEINEQDPPPLTFALSLLYRGATTPTALDGHDLDEISIDLVSLRDEINALIEVEEQEAAERPRKKRR